MKKSLILCIIILAIYAPAHSAIVDWTVNIAGETYDAFKDEDSGLVWLDIDTYAGNSYNEVQTLLTGTGFAIATQSQMTALLASIGNMSYDNLALIVGETYGSQNKYVYGFFNDQDQDTYHLSICYWIGNSPNMNGLLLVPNHSLANINTKRGMTGAWVVQDVSSVPIPSILLLLGF